MSRLFRQDQHQDQDFFFKTKTKTIFHVLEAPRDQDQGLETTSLSSSSSSSSSLLHTCGHVTELLSHDNNGSSHFHINLDVELRSMWHLYKLTQRLRNVDKDAGHLQLSLHVPARPPYLEILPMTLTVEYDLDVHQRVKHLGQGHLVHTHTDNRTHRSSYSTWSTQV